jgi:thiamine biosynthesis protein ThiS
MDTVMIEVNGRKLPWEEGMTVKTVLARMNYTFPMIIVRVNGELVDKKEWETHAVPPGAVVPARPHIAGG